MKIIAVLPEIPEKNLSNLCPLNTRFSTNVAFNIGIVLDPLRVDHFPHFFFEQLVHRETLCLKFVSTPIDSHQPLNTNKIISSFLEFLDLL